MDAARVEELYRRHVPAARGFACALLGGDVHSAEDLVHDAFLKASSRLVTLRDEDAFGAYLHRAVANAVVSFARRRAVERRWRNRQFPPGAVSAVNGQVESEEEVLRRLRLLPPRQRVAVAARVCLDLSEAQTAELLGCSIGTVKSLTSRGLAALRAAEMETTR
jgi:RNA polymerase sigma factor (sigma-70 family)